MDTTIAGRTARYLDLLHAMCYFLPETEQRMVAAGLDRGRACYFAGRSAAMGAVAAEVVIATFYNFDPDLIRSVIPNAWTQARPDVVVEARYRAVDDGMTRVFGPDVIGSADLAETAELVATAARAIPGPQGRPLYAGHASIPWPAKPHLVLWHSLTLLREYRGDGHVVALQANRLSGLEALITHTATGVGFQERFARTRRGWPDEVWDAAVTRLIDRRLLAPSGELTDEGRAVRTAVESLTDELAYEPWAALGDARLNRVTELAKPLRRTLVQQGVFPDGVFGPSATRF